MASRLAHVLEEESHVPRSDGDKINSTAVGVGKAPLWAGQAKDARDVLHWDSEQYVAEVLVGDHLALGVVDTGGCKTLICENTAKSLGL